CESAAKRFCAMVACASGVAGSRSATSGGAATRSVSRSARRSAKVPVRSVSMSASPRRLQRALHVDPHARLHERIGAADVAGPGLDTADAPAGGRDDVGCPPAHDVALSGRRVHSVLGLVEPDGAAPVLVVL